MYQLISAQKLPSGFILHEAKTYAGQKNPERVRYYGMRFALVWPTAKSPAYFVGGGAEVYDEKLDPISGGIIRVTAEYESADLGLEGFLDILTDYMSAQISDTVYCDMSKEDFREAFYSYLDKRGLRNISVIQAPYSDFVFRIGKLRDSDKAGNLLIGKESPLRADINGIARLDLQDEPEVRFYRLSGLSMLVAGFLKYPPRPPITINIKRMLISDWRL